MGINHWPQDRGRDIEQALTALREEMKSLAAPPRVEAAVIQAFRAGPPKRRSPRWVWSLAATVAAGIALAVFGPLPERPALAPPAVALRHAPPAPLIRVVKRPAPRRAVMAASPRPRQREVATGFFPVRYGVPAWGDLAAPVQADIIVGRDRVAQAIRFVR